MCREKVFYCILSDHNAINIETNNKANYRTYKKFTETEKHTTEDGIIEEIKKELKNS